MLSVGCVYGDIIPQHDRRPTREKDKQMNRTAVNPWPWSLNVGYNQAEIIEGAKRQVNVAGQTSVDGEGNPMHNGDMRAQIALALENLEAVLAAAGMGLGDITKLGVYATDVDEAMKNFDLLGMKFGPLQAAPPMTLLGVSRLAIPGLMFEIEATAAD
jgi:enamine deaminase RidA (YjgF/YER057c/UK114 family)